MKLDKNIFRVKPSQNHKPQRKIHISIHNIQRTIVKPTANIEILAVLFITQASSSLFSQFHPLSTKLQIFELTILEITNVITIATIANIIFISISILKKLSNLFVLSFA
jgi:hypothetical protein